MPRPKSEITNQRGYVGIRLTEEQREIYRKLGGPDWLRAYLNDIIERHSDKPRPQKINPATTERMVAVRQVRPQEVSFQVRAHRPFG